MHMVLTATEDSFVIEDSYMEINLREAGVFISDRVPARLNPCTGESVKRENM